MRTQEELAARPVVSFSIGKPDDAKIVWLRASGVRWKLIAWRLGYESHDRVASVGGSVDVDRVASQWSG